PRTDVGDSTSTRGRALPAAGLTIAASVLLESQAMPYLLRTIFCLLVLSRRLFHRSPRPAMRLQRTALTSTARTACPERWNFWRSESAKVLQPDHHPGSAPQQVTT